MSCGRHDCKLYCYLCARLLSLCDSALLDLKAIRINTSSIMSRFACMRMQVCALCNPPTFFALSLY